ncbi:hypothetical protein M885DRAFT_497505 [Pelagophyceae sp. CCMP2097]|nr:hypothetical protein M885DRAFT_497505 [Pelagophyceae sp. CCMP2097]
MHADFVVVGSGPAGCACAAAIVEHARDATVIILERGAPSEDELSCRAAFPSCIARPASGYMPTLKLFQGCAWSGEGQVVGGGSAVNAGALLGDAAYWRGGWSAHGSSTLWGAEDMTRCERDAPVSCLDAGARWQAFVPRNVLAWSARRRSAADLVYGHGRIRIVPGADVEKIEWCGTRATGVLLRSGAVVGATRVIVAGGAVSTAELLFRSGVGSEETIGKGVVIRSPALGRDVYDHVTVAVPLVDLRGALTAGEAALCAAAVLAAALRPGRAAVRVAAVVAVVVAAAALKLRPTAADACGRPAYRAVAFDDEAQLSFFPAQALVAMASILGGPDGGGPLPLHARPQPSPITRALEAVAHWILRSVLRLDAGVGTLWHAAGGAARGTVVDVDDLHLLGAEALHVVGAAAMPRLPRVNPMAMCYAMGWRLGEILATEHEARRAR